MDIITAWKLPIRGETKFILVKDTEQGYLVNCIVMSLVHDTQNREWRGPYLYKNSLTRWAQAHANPRSLPCVVLYDNELSALACIDSGNLVASDSPSTNSSGFPEPTPEMIESFHMIYGEDAEYEISPTNGQLQLKTN